MFDKSEEEMREDLRGLYGAEVDEMSEDDLKELYDELWADGELIESEFDELTGED